MFESVLVPFKDEFPTLRRYPGTISLVASAISFVLGLSMATQGGMYVLNLIDTYLGGTMLPIIAIFELYAVCWLYGIKRLALDIEFMLGAPPPLFLKLCWVVICPLSLTVIVVVGFVQYTPLTLESYVYPGWAESMGLFLLLVGLVQIPIFAFLHLRKNNYDLMRSMDPHPSWGPSDPEVNERYKRFMAEHGAPLHSGASLPVRSQTEGRTLPIEAAPEVEEEPAMATGATHDTTVISPSTRDTGTLDQSGSSQPPEMPRPTTPEYGMTEDVYVVKGGLDDAKQAEKAAEV